MNLIKLLTCCAAMISMLGAAAAKAQEPVRIGMALPLSGVFTSYGQQAKNGIQVFLDKHGTTVAGRQIEIIYRDTGGGSAESGHRLAQELVSRYKVDILGGFLITPQAFAAAPVATAAKVPLFVMLAGSSSVTEKSPYIVRTSYTNAQMAYPLGQWAAKNGIKTAYSLVADFGPGHDAEHWFKKGFTENGGQIVGETRVPPTNHDFAPFVQRIKDVEPDAAFVFLQAGDASIGFLKEAAGRKLAEAGVRTLALEGFTDDDTLAAVGDAALGVISAGFYTTDYDIPMNTEFLSGFNAVDGGKLPPNFIAVAAYDAMRVIYSALEALDGEIDSDRLIEAVKGMHVDSPRGVLVIDKETRDAVQDIYIRKIERVDGSLVNRNFDKIPMVKDPAN